MSDNSIALRMLREAKGLEYSDPPRSARLKAIAMETRQLEEAVDLIVGNAWEDQQAKIEAAKQSANVVFFPVGLFADQNLDIDDAR